MLLVSHSAAAVSCLCGVNIVCENISAHSNEFC